MELTNFKSYKGTHNIGSLDSNFISIIGTNGSGKSNCMDAISFGFGVHARDLRGGSLKDLIYYREGQERPTTASVSLRFETDDETNELGSEKVFTRRINANGSSSYMIGGDTVAKQRYADELEELNIYVKSRNFLVFQGDITSIASKETTELTKFFERISGSVEYKADYDNLKAQKAVAERDLNDVVQRRKAISQEKKMAERQKQEADHYHEKRKRLAEEKTQLTLWKLHHNRQEYQNAVTDVSKCTKKVDAVQLKIDAATADIETQTREIGKHKKQLRNCKKQVSSLVKSQRKLRLNLSEAKKFQKALSKDLAADESLQEQLEAKIKKQEKKLKKLRQHLSTVEEEQTELDATILSDIQDAGRTKLDLSAEQLHEYGKLKALSTEKAAGLMQKLNVVEERLAHLRAKKVEVRKRSCKTCMLLVCACF